MDDANSSSELGITAKDMGVESTPEGIERLFGQSFEAKRIENGKPIPVGGSNILNDKLNKEVMGDFDHFNDLFEEMHDAISIYDSDNLKNWLKTQYLSVDSKLIAALTAFTKKLEERYPISLENATLRKDMYFGTGGSKEVKLSDIFESHSAECAEIAALAQYFLQSEDVNSSFFSGEVLWTKDSEFGEKHSFIVIRNKDNRYLFFDPANPTKAQDGIYPSIYTVKADFDREVRKGQKRFVAGANILTNREVYYGVGNGTNVSGANIVN